MNAAFFERFFLNLYLYALLSWCAETVIFALAERRYVNRGYLNLPVNMPCGVAAAMAMEALPTLEHHGVLQFLLTLIVCGAVRRFADQYVRNRRPEIVQPRNTRLYAMKRLAVDVLIAAALLVTYLVVHPVLMGALLLVPDWIRRLMCVFVSALVIADSLCVRCALRTGGAAKRRDNTQRLGERIAGGVWRRLERAYPAIDGGADAPARRPVFAQGVCRDKMVWVFLISSFLGALIEMAYCRLTGGVWMNRSSVLYGAFSFVWGFGAVVLTVVLQPLAQKNDRWVFLAGFVVGGAYEYLCSVFTERVFGTVFWDYSHMTLNIGGRTNVLYCVFWGLLAVVWLKVIYPPMDRFIERIPPLAGKAATWIVVLVMACNGLLTSAAMIRYTNRQSAPVQETVVDAFLDRRYDDAWMEQRWPNMVVAKGKPDGKTER